jgi:hypothetical protein
MGGKGHKMHECQACGDRSPTTWRETFAPIGYFLACCVAQLAAWSLVILYRSTLEQGRLGAAAFCGTYALFFGYISAVAFWRCIRRALLLPNS